MAQNHAICLKIPTNFSPTIWTETSLPALTDPEERVETDGHPVGQQFLHHRLCPADTRGQDLRTALKAQCTKRFSPLSSLLTFVAWVWGSWPHTAPPGRSAEFWGCLWNTPACHEEPRSAARPRRLGLWGRRSAGSPEYEWTEGQKAKVRCS